MVLVHMTGDDAAGWSLPTSPGAMSGLIPDPDAGVPNGNPG